MTTTFGPSASESPEVLELVCPKCRHSNPSTAECCSQCHRHLHVFCGHCGHSNARSNRRCTECRTQLHLAWPHRWKQAQARRWIKPVEIVLLVVSVALTYQGIVKIAEFEFPRNQFKPPQVYLVKPDGTWQSL
jgi:hypothetical protein